MKIPNLYTRGQFIDLMDELYPPSEPETAEEYQFYVSRYNYFLKQATTRDKFVCEVEEPQGADFVDGDPRYDGTYSHQSYLDAYDEYEAAQKKVIFDGWSQSVYMKYEIIKGTDIIDFSNYDFPKLSQRNSQIVSVKTLHNLAEATKGQLKIKNIEL